MQGIVFSMVIVRLGLGLSTPEGTTKAFRDINYPTYVSNAWPTPGDKPTDANGGKVPHAIHVHHESEMFTTMQSTVTTGSAGEGDSLPWAPVRPYRIVMSS